MVISKAALWEAGHDETVEVNQRALIDKVLARYSGEFTVFRELLQNSDDAQSKAVEIRFESRSFLDKGTNQAGSETTVDMQCASEELPDLRATHVHQWTFKNNGFIFKDEDWNRLKKIAEGNPDEEKIGAFGVGFYSLFSVTEEPFVTSGDQWMAFYWKDKKDQLFARRGQLPTTEDDPAARLWTSFTMALREPAPIPIPFDFTRFLASSITFMRHLSEVSVYFDDKRLVKLCKASGLPRDLGLPKGLNNRSPLGTMTVSNIQSTPLYIQAEVMKWIYTSGTENGRLNVPKSLKAYGTGGGFLSSLFSSLSGVSASTRVAEPSLPQKIIDPLAINETSVSLSIYSASIQVHLDKKLSSEIYRSTKKNPPTRTKFELIYTAKDEYDASREEDAKQPEATGSIFQGLRADIEGVGAARVFIGHSTAQSTGLGGHVAARFIPTVERESIDFMDRHVAIWNKELLYVGGFLSRAAYEFELATVQKQWEASSSPMKLPSPEIQAQLVGRVLHALKFFIFNVSTPSPNVSSLMEAAFFACSSNGYFPVISNKGVRSSKDVRLPDPSFCGFLKELPVLPDEITTGADPMIASLQARGLIKAIDFQDILRELQSRPLARDESVACLKWWINTFHDGNRDQLLPIRTQLINAMILAIAAGNDGDEKIIPLAAITHFINPKNAQGPILEAPLPNYLLPLTISKCFMPDMLSSSFPWTEFTLLHWVSYICDRKTAPFPPEFDVSISAIWAERVILLISRGWHKLEPDSKIKIVNLLRDKTCIPTSGGMKLPHESYFPNINIFGDLPVVTFPSITAKIPVKMLLQDLGVRKHVELQIVFNRMIKTNEWTIADLAKYLVSVKDTLTDEEIQRLRATCAFPEEKKLEDSNVRRTRYRASQLYEPLDVLRALGLPIIDWGQKTKWRSTSEEAKFLFELGLQRYPSLDKLINICADDDIEIRSAALKYLIDNIGFRYQAYDPMDFQDVPFIPALKESTPCMGNIREVFSNADWASLGFSALHPTYQPHATKLKIKENPPASHLISLLHNSPPADCLQATKWFSLFAARVNDFKNSDLHLLSTVSFIPTKAETDAAGPVVRWLPPSQCYLAPASPETFHSKLFTFVDFGASANAFLSACGTRSQPSVDEVAKILLHNPSQFYQLAGGPTNFLAELRNLAVNTKNISSLTYQRMKRSPILLGLQRKPRRQDNKASEDWDEDDWDTLYELKKPSEIVIADDTHAYQAFSDSNIFTAPQEDIIEEFYGSLGSLRLSHIVREEYQPSGELINSKVAHDIRSLILQRLPLFLHEHTHARTRVAYSWFSSDNNFIVKAFGKVEVQKHLNFGDVRLSRKQDASAVGRRRASGAIELWIAGNTQIDMYEIATSLNRLLFESPKTNDAMLFMTILSTELSSLKRRGYNVDRILRQQKETRQVVENARKAKEQEDARLFSAPSPPNVDKSPLDSKASHQQNILTPLPIHNASEGRTTPSPFLHSVQSFRRKFGSITLNQNEKLPTSEKKPHPSQASITIPTAIPPSHKPITSQLLPTQNVTSTNHSEGSKPLPLTPSGATQGHSPARTPDAGVTPWSNISKNIELAINSCRPESGDLLQIREHMQRVKESTDDGYCDISGRKENLHNIAQMGSVKIYISDEVPMIHAETFMEGKRASIARFIRIMTSLANIYQLPLTNLHIFYDLKGGIIAFNRNSSIFLNLRYFEERHDADVSKGNLQAAYTSWYFTIAHEVAHNLVQPHNSEHEFYFSAICERFITDLAGLLGSRG